MFMVLYKFAKDMLDIASITNYPLESKLENASQLVLKEV